MVLVSVGWTIAKPFVRQSEWSAGTAAGNIVEVQADVLDPENADGSGQAGQAALGEDMIVQYDTPGWQLCGEIAACRQPQLHKWLDGD